MGIFENFEIDEGQLLIPEGGTLLLFSDGLSETIEDQQDSPELLRLCETIFKNQDLDARACCKELWKKSGGSEVKSLIKDDFTVVVIRSYSIGDDMQ